ncbi:MAG: putative oxidoreductase [Kiritimatiellia bacterium]|jgi:putative oxidoreductase
MMILVSYALRLVVAAVFIYAGLLKISDPWMFAKQVHAYQMLADEHISLVAIFLPWLELVAGFGMILGGFRVRTAGTILCMLMLAAFIGAQAYALYKGMVIDCGCFGGAKKVTWSGVAVNGGWFLLALGGLFLDRKPET